MQPRWRCESQAPQARPFDLSRSEIRVPVAALTVERLHSLLRRMPAHDWDQFKALLSEHLQEPEKDHDIDVLERLFRHGEALGGQAGGTVLRRLQEAAGCPPLMDQLRNANERLRERVRFVLRELSPADWQSFKLLLASQLCSPTIADDLGVVELVFRIGESITNVETAALALCDRVSGRKLIQPEVARRNAQLRVPAPGAPRLDPEAAYQSARKAIAEAEETASRAANTLARHYIAPTSAYKHARNTVFRIVDAIVGSEALMTEISRLEATLLAAEPVNREDMRWAMHRLPLRERLEIIRQIPLNTILLFQAGAGTEAWEEAGLRATRDRRLAYDYFVRHRGIDELAPAYGLSPNGIKNELGTILETLTAKPMARQVVQAYLTRVRAIPPMTIEEVRRRMKRLTSTARAQLLNRIPDSAWRVRGAMFLHKQLFLDYLSGEWLLAALVNYYNLEKKHRLAGRFKFEGNLTIRGAHAAIAGMLHKIAAEPELRAQLRLWTDAPSQPSSPPPPPSEPVPGTEPDEFAVWDFLPPPPKPLGV